MREWQSQFQFDETGNKKIMSRLIFKILTEFDYIYYSYESISDHSVWKYRLIMGIFRMPKHNKTTQVAGIVIHNIKLLTYVRHSVRACSPLLYAFDMNNTASLKHKVVNNSPCFRSDDDWVPSFHLTQYIIGRQGSLTFLPASALAIRGGILDYSSSSSSSSTVAQCDGRIIPFSVALLFISPAAEWCCV